MDRFANDDQDDTISMGPPVPPVPPPPGGGWRWRPPHAAIFAGVAVIALAGGLGIGYAATHSSPANVNAAVAAASPSPTPSTPKGTPPGMTRHRWFGGVGPFGFGFAGVGRGGVLHGQVTIQKPGGGYETLDVQRGTVAVVSATSLTVKSTDGYTTTYAVASDTLVDAKARGLGSVKNGDTVLVTATADSKRTAVNVVDITAIKKRRASLGFPTNPAKPKIVTPATPSAGI